MVQAVKPLESEQFSKSVSVKSWGPSQLVVCMRGICMRSQGRVEVSLQKNNTINKGELHNREQSCSFIIFGREQEDLGVVHYIKLFIHYNKLFGIICCCCCKQELCSVAVYSLNIIIIIICTLPRFQLNRKYSNFMYLSNK